MTVADLVPPAAPHVPAGRHRALREPALRGDLHVADGVVEKITATALGEVPEIGGTARRVLGVAVGSDDLPHVTATVSGGAVVLDAAVSVVYPAPVAPATDRARAHVVDRVGELTGLRVERVDITVTALTRPPTSPLRRELT